MLAVNDTEILTQPDFTDLMSTLKPDHEVPAEVTAWWAGEEIPAEALIPALDVGVRIGVEDSRGHDIIDRALARLHEEARRA